MRRLAFLGPFIACLIYAAAAQGNYLYEQRARELLWGYGGHDPDVQIKRAALEEVRNVDIVDTQLAYTYRYSDHHVAPSWRYIRACYPGCGPDAEGSTAGFYLRWFDSRLNHETGSVKDDPRIPN